MKKIVLGLSLLLSTFAFSQQRTAQGLENIIVEKYYISNAADSIKADADAEDAGPDYVKGTLLSGSVTYRVYADLLPNYKLVSVYSDSSRKQDIIFKTATSFYNHPAGDIHATGNKKDIANSVLALDSYLTLGGAAKGFYGILKKDDDAVASWFTTNNPDGVLLNDAPAIGIPLTQKDGFIAGTGIQTPFLAGFDASILGDGTKVGSSIETGIGAYYTTSVVRGPDTVENKVLIAQITTKGRFQFELNILVQSMIDGRAQYFVAKNPKPSSSPLDADDDVKLDFLAYDSDVITDVPTINTAKNDLAVSFYPNPANEFLNMEINAIQPNSKGSYIVYGLLGNVITQKELTGINGTYKEEIDISSFAKGLYTIQVNINGTTTAKKIIKN